jgi:hypothetical protein
MVLFIPLAVALLGDGIEAGKRWFRVKPHTKHIT